MTSEPAPRRRAGGVLTALVVLVCVAILTGLGVWQVKRLHWKEDLLRRVAAAQTAAPQPIAPVLERLSRGADVEWTRVRADCSAPPPGVVPAQHARYGILEGEVVWRAMVDCRLKGAPYGSIRLDRGYIDAVRGQVSPPARVDLAPPQQVQGVLRRPPRKERPANAAPGGEAPMLLVVDRETPQPPGVTPAAYPTNIPNNHLGYAITWFGLAIALACVYGSALWKARRGR
jgi:surfeit locus 1 family protein